MRRDASASNGRLPAFPLFALLAGAIALGSSPILVRLSELPPTATAFYRVALAAPAFLIFSFARGETTSFAVH
ncbi:MAG TPA: EamA/RhaT family transporter, partial [Xanthobacteraceae bacterium]